MIEAALTHQPKDRAERAYVRGNWLEKRRDWIQAWADYKSKKSRTLSVC